MSHEENRRIKQQYDRIAARYDLVDRLIPRSWRVKATQLAYGRVLEAGVGTGLNLPYYTDRCQKIVGIDLSLPMLEQAAQRVHQCKVPVVLAEMDIQALDLASASFDCVLVSFVFCTGSGLKVAQGPPAITIGAVSSRSTQQTGTRPICRMSGMLK